MINSLDVFDFIKSVKKLLDLVLIFGRDAGDLVDRKIGDFSFGEFSDTEGGSKFSLGLFEGFRSDLDFNVVVFLIDRLDIDIIEDEIFFDFFNGLIGIKGDVCDTFSSYINTFAQRSTRDNLDIASMLDLVGTLRRELERDADTILR